MSQRYVTTSPSSYNNREGLGKLHMHLEIPSCLGYDRPQRAQRHCDNVVTTSWLALSQRSGTVENEGCGDVGL